MTPPVINFQDLPGQAFAQAKNCPNEKLAMTLQYVAVGSMIAMTGLAAIATLKSLFDDPGKGRCR